MNMQPGDFGSDPRKEPQEHVTERLGGFIAKLGAEADRRVRSRSSVEDRWLRDLEQYHGRYDRSTWERLKAKKKSRVFLNLTRAKTNSMMARLWDLLFPTDDRNWSIQPTPVPELNDEIESLLSIVDDANETMADRQSKMLAAEGRGAAGEDEANEMSREMERLEKIRNKAQDAADKQSLIVQEAARRCDLMEKEIEDQLTECGYQAEARKMIRDACKIGTGVIKGPVNSDKVRRRWMQEEVVRKEPGGIVTDIVEEKKPQFFLANYQSEKPAAVWVDPWSFFPTPDATEPDESEGIYERHLMKPHMLRKLARRSDINENAVRSLLKKGVNTEAAPSYLVNLREITEQNEVETEDLYHVWEYTGPLDTEDLQLLLEAGIDDRIEDVIEDVDLLQEIHVRIWFCQDEILSFALHPLDSNDPLYCVYNLQEDEASMFGFGIPYLMRDEQRATNAAKRMMMDNSALSTGPQIFINKKLVEPANGSYTLEAMKVWLIDDEKYSESKVPPIEMFNIDGHQSELANLIELNRQDIDEVVSLPQIAQGEQGVGVTKTAQGMALLMNSANVGFRMFVKNFDDNVTVPLVQRFYDWNMQFSPKEEIKGDYEVDARGSSVLLVREMQANNLMMIMTGLSNDPKYGIWLKDESLLKELFRAHNISADEHVKTRREMERDAERAAQQTDPAVEIEKMKLELEREKLQLQREEVELKAASANQEWILRERIARLDYARAMQIDVARLNVEMEKVEAQAGDRTAAERIKADSSERKLAAEIAMKRETGVSAGGSV